MADKKPDKRTVAARIESADIEELEAIARSDRRTLSFVIADAVKAYIASQKQARKHPQPRKR